MPYLSFIIILTNTDNYKLENIQKFVCSEEGMQQMRSTAFFLL